MHPAVALETTCTFELFGYDHHSEMAFRPCGHVVAGALVDDFEKVRGELAFESILDGLFDNHGEDSNTCGRTFGPVGGMLRILNSPRESPPGESPNLSRQKEMQ